MIKTLSILALLWISIPATAKEFIHPGAVHSKAQLDFVKAKIHEGAQPWKDEFEKIKLSGYAKRGPHGQLHNNSGNDDASASKDDAIAAYTQALLWYFTDDDVYAKRTIAILNSWSGLEGFTAGSDQDRLQAGWVGASMAPAAEIMRGYSGWTQKEIEDLQAMFRRAFYPQLNTASNWNGNVDLTQIDAMLSIAVFNEDDVVFNRGIERLRIRSRAYFYLKSDGPLPTRIAGDGDDIKKFWSHPKKWVDGLTQETCRDNGHHSQFGLGSALHAAETAWHQGVDVYTEHQERYTAAMELMAAQFLSGSMQGVSGNDLPTSNRFNTFEVGYNHYHNRVGAELPYTKKLIETQIRPKSQRAICNLIYETLTHGDLPKISAE